MSKDKQNNEKKIIEVKCPHCKEKFLYYDSEYRPFCSKRCKMVDLGHWVDGSYSIPVVNRKDDGSCDEEIPEE